MTIPQIDTSNITNAFVSGMKEDLNLYGNQYNYIVTSWTVGYIIGQWVCLISLYSSSVQRSHRFNAAFELHLDSSPRS
jgi:hypothetical protein